MGGAGGSFWRRLLCADEQASWWLCNVAKQQNFWMECKGCRTKKVSFSRIQREKHTHQGRCRGACRGYQSPGWCQIWTLPFPVWVVPPSLSAGQGRNWSKTWLTRENIKSGKQPDHSRLCSSEDGTRAKRTDQDVSWPDPKSTSGNCIFSVTNLKCCGLMGNGRHPQSTGILLNF